MKRHHEDEEKYPNKELKEDVPYYKEAGFMTELMNSTYIPNVSYDAFFDRHTAWFDDNMGSYWRKGNFNDVYNDDDPDFTDSKGYSLDTGMFVLEDAEWYDRFRNALIKKSDYGEVLNQELAHRIRFKEEQYRYEQQRKASYAFSKIKTLYSQQGHKGYETNLLTAIKDFMAPHDELGYHIYDIEEERLTKELLYLMTIDYGKGDFESPFIDIHGVLYFERRTRELTARDIARGMDVNDLPTSDYKIRIFPNFYDENDYSIYDTIYD